MQSIMRRTNDIQKYCACAAALKKHTTKKKFVTAGNNPQISQRMRYSEYIRTVPTKEIVIPLIRPQVIQNITTSY